MNALGYTVERFPVSAGDKVWEPRLAQLAGVTFRKDAPTAEDPKAVVETNIPGKLIWQPVEILAANPLPTICYRRHYECFTYCESLNRSNGNKSHAKVLQDQ